jgi:hypothetical protein
LRLFNAAAAAAAISPARLQLQQCSDLYRMDADHCILHNVREFIVQTIILLYFGTTLRQLAQYAYATLDSSCPTLQYCLAAQLEQPLHAQLLTIELCFTL